MIRVLFVCLGNICRSPTAEGVMRTMLAQAGLEAEIAVDSAGTAAYHQGEAPDRRSQQAAKARGYDLGGMKARKVLQIDFSRFDYVLAMDSDNLRQLQALRPADATAQVMLFLDFAKQLGLTDVPDPYYGGAQGFSQVLDLCEAASQGLIDHIRRSIG
ncbi:MAG: low molecular weight protein-tyrosine-phosphatase [Rhodospirillales bacterium]